MKRWRSLLILVLSLLVVLGGCAAPQSPPAESTSLPKTSVEAAAPQPPETPATPAPAPATAPATVSNVQITHIFFAGLVPDTESDEYVEIINSGTNPQDLAGWVLKDGKDGYPSFTFPTYLLRPGEKIRVYTNEIHPEYGGFSFNWKTGIWNNEVPDTAVLYDAQGQVVSRKSY